jgi:hypothetical protein
MRRLLTALLSFLALATPANAQQRDTTFAADRLTARERAILLATVGSAGGLLAGGAGGIAVCEVTGWGDSGEDPCLGQLMIGMFAGSIVGSAIGAYLPTRKLGRGLPLGYAMGGMIIGLGAGYLSAELTDSPAGYLIGYSLTQGIVTGLLATRVPD